LARRLGMGKLGHVAIDSTRIAANAAADSIESVAKLRAERAKIRRRIRRWQQQCDAEDPHEGAGTAVGTAAWQQQLEQIPVRLQRLRKAHLQKLSRTDEDSRFLRDRKGFTLGYTATVAVSDDHLIVAQQISQEGNDNGLLVPLVQAVTHTCGEPPQRVSADSGFFSNDNARAMEESHIDAYVPDSNLARVLNRGGKLQVPAYHPAQRRMRRKLRSPAGRAIYQRRKALVEPILGILKEQRGMRRFRLRGWSKVAAEFALATTALNLTRVWRVTPHL
jgi:Transposase DDE domain